MGFLSRLFGSSKPEKTPTPPPAPPPPEEPDPVWPEISPADCVKMISDGGIVVLDVRTQPEYESRRIDGSVLAPVQTLHRVIDKLDKNATYLVHCEHGMRSADACYMLKRAGFANVSEMAGGLAVYNGPTTRGPIAK
ncbi:MAG: rhodanese-like domain-containing protein [Planctomycetota bacterium]